jgi:hypothetical protein
LGVGVRAPWGGLAVAGRVWPAGRTVGLGVYRTTSHRLFWVPNRFLGATRALSRVSFRTENEIWHRENESLPEGNLSRVEDRLADWRRTNGLSGCRVVELSAHQSAGHTAG